MRLEPEEIDLLAVQIAERLAAKIVPPPEPYLDSEEAAHYIGHKGNASKKMSELAASGKLRFYRDGKRLAFKRQDLDTYMAL